MGRMLGAHDNGPELDRPDLNKCPDCGCFFASDTCPICGKVCPEEMRAGNRAPVKAQKPRRNQGSGRVTFVSWYHSWWFIILMMVFSPIIAIVLLVTSPHEKWKKTLCISIAALSLAVSFIGSGNIIAKVTDIFDRPVDTSLTEEEYIDACEKLGAEQFYRVSGDYDEDFVCLTLEVVARASSTDDYYDDDTYYICRAPSNHGMIIIVRNCLINSSKNLIAGDLVTVYGEVDGEKKVYDAEYNSYEGPCINMAYATLEMSN